MSNSDEALRCLVSGDVCGEYSTLFKRVKSLQKKGAQFDLLMCVGDFFGPKRSDWEEYKSGRLKVPISTLILGPNRAADVEYYEGKDGQEICPNAIYLGRCGRYTGSSGLQIAYLSGLDGCDSQKQDDWHFTREDVLTLSNPVTGDSNYKGIDILLTSQWPQGVHKYAATPEKEAVNVSPWIGEVARILKPRYHFSALNDTFYERQPYRNHQVLADSPSHTTRFISLAQVGNDRKEKFLYAFTITPMIRLSTVEMSKQPIDATECPFMPLSVPGNQEKQTQFFYQMKTDDSGKGMKRPGRQEDVTNKKKKPNTPTGSCWFCLGSPEVEKHLVVSVATQTYLALAKGGLVNDHVLILPIGHYQSYVTSPAQVQEEIISYKKSLKKYFKHRGKAVVFCERNYKTQHLQIQAIPIPQDATASVKEVFLDHAESESIELHEIPQHSDLNQIVPAGVPYFYVELPCGGKLLHRISRNFPLQLAREVLAHPDLLNVPERIDWRNCSANKEDATDMASDFKVSFKEFDFSIS